MQAVAFFRCFYSCFLFFVLFFGKALAFLSRALMLSHRRETPLWLLRRPRDVARPKGIPLLGRRPRVVERSVDSLLGLDVTDDVYRVFGRSVGALTTIAIMVPCR